MGTLRNFLSYILKHVVRVLIRKIEDRTTIDAKLNRCIIKMRESLEKYGAPDIIRLVEYRQNFLLKSIEFVWRLDGFCTLFCTSIDRVLSAYSQLT